MNERHAVRQKVKFNSKFGDSPSQSPPLLNKTCLEAVHPALPALSTIPSPSKPWGPAIDRCLVGSDWT